MAYMLGTGPIVINGLRPGETLFEGLLANDEDTWPHASQSAASGGADACKGCVADHWVRHRTCSACPDGRQAQPRMTVRACEIAHVLR